LQRHNIQGSPDRCRILLGLADDWISESRFIAARCAIGSRAGTSGWLLEQFF
jgi:hypothetical protein